MSIVIGSLNYYSAFILVKSSQHIAKKLIFLIFRSISTFSESDVKHWIMAIFLSVSVKCQTSSGYAITASLWCNLEKLAYFVKKASNFRIIVDMTILLYQLGMCAVAILFISENLVGQFEVAEQLVHALPNRSLKYQLETIFSAIWFFISWSFTWKRILRMKIQMLSIKSIGTTIHGMIYWSICHCTKIFGA